MTAAFPWNLLEGKPYTENSVGMSGAKVLIYEDWVLKTGPADPRNAETVQVMRWLRGKVPVPEVLGFESRDGRDALLMGRLKGKMACDPYYLSRPELLLDLLAGTMRQLWSVDAATCPRDCSLAVDLAEAERRVAAGLVDRDNAEPETFGPGGFRNPEHLLAWLIDNRPEEDLVLSHGDFCLPNLFFTGDRLEGLIDLGECGTADRYKDVALCWRSLRHNLDGHYGGDIYPPPDEAGFFRRLGVPKDEEKLRYFTLLDELF